jgi:hypothetical protein
MAETGGSPAVSAEKSVLVEMVTLRAIKHRVKLTVGGKA